MQDPNDYGAVTVHPASGPQVTEISDVVQIACDDLGIIDIPANATLGQALRLIYKAGLKDNADLLSGINRTRRLNGEKEYAETEFYGWMPSKTQGGRP